MTSESLPLPGLSYENGSSTTDVLWSIRRHFVPFYVFLWLANVPLNLKKRLLDTEGDIWEFLASEFID